MSLASPTNQSLALNWLLPAANLSGGTKSTRLLAEAMVRRGHDVRLIYPSLAKPWPSVRHPRVWVQRLRREMRAWGRQRHHLESSTARLMPIPRRPIPGELVPDADFAIASWWETRYWIEDWPASRGRPAYMVRGHELHGGDPARVAATYRMPGQKFVISRWLQRVMAEEYGDHGAVLTPNGVDRAQFDAPPRERSETPTVGMLSGHAPWKGSDVAFAAIRRAQRELPGLRAIAFGSQPPQRSADLPANFEFHLRPPQDEIPRLYRRCDCWLVSSTIEGFGMPGIEAAACRCPVVSTRCGGPEDYVEDGVNGYLVDVGDAEAMGARLIEVLTCPASRWRGMSEASHEISRRFDWDRSAEIMENTLVAILRGADGASERDGALNGARSDAAELR